MLDSAQKPLHIHLFIFILDRTLVISQLDQSQLLFLGFLKSTIPASTDSIYLKVETFIF